MALPTVVPHPTLRRKLLSDLARIEGFDEVVDDLELLRSDEKARLHRAIDIHGEVLREQLGGQKGDFFMTESESFREVMRRIFDKASEVRRPDVTWRVFTMACTFLTRESEVAATREAIAERALTTADEVSRAMVTLERLAVVERVREAGRVRYYLDSAVTWKGTREERAASLAKHGRRGSKRPDLRVVDPIDA